MGNNKSGFENEDKLIEYLNNKKVKQLNDNLKRFIFFLFNDLNDESVISTSYGNSGQKPDMVININR